MKFREIQNFLRIFQKITIIFVTVSLYLVVFSSSSDFRFAPSHSASFRALPCFFTVVSQNFYNKICNFSVFYIKILYFTIYNEKGKARGKFFWGHGDKKGKCCKIVEIGHPFCFFPLEKMTHFLFLKSFRNDSCRLCMTHADIREKQTFLNF